MAVYLVTGGAGFIGSHISEDLLRRGHSVRILDNFSTGKRNNLEMVVQAAGGNDHLEICEGDLRSYHTVLEAVAGVDYIIHQGALPSVSRAVQDPLTSNDVNVTGTLHVLYAALKADVKRVVYASSSSVYGDNPILPKHEALTPMPLSPYAVSKLAAEQYCQVFTHIYGLETVSLRYFNVFGPRQDPTSLYSAVIPRFITAALQDNVVTINGDGLQSRDFTYVTNVVRANLLACEAPGAAGHTINVSCGARYSLLDLLDQLTGLLGKQIKCQHTDSRVGDVKHSQASIERAGELLGYEPAVSFADGLALTVEWYKKHMHQAA
jgi:nucleoside-diphosphate-sugar epimerase